MASFRILMAAGGTGGHLYPGIALARAFQQRLPAVWVRFVGTARGLEHRVLPREGYPLEVLPLVGWQGRRLGSGMRVLARLPGALWRVDRLLRSARPHLVVGTGGYVAGPVVGMAILHGIPTAILEPNAIPGLTNRLLAPGVDWIFLGFEAARTGALRRGEVVGIPVREGFEKIPPVRIESSPVLLVLGGSQGARAINRAVVEALPQLRQRQGGLRIIHQTGNQDREWVARTYREVGIQARVTPFLEDMVGALAQAHLVVARAGASTVAEILAAGRPSLLIPYPHATGAHQEHNARALARAGACQVLSQREMEDGHLGEQLVALLENPRQLEDMGNRARSLARPGAAQVVADRVLEHFFGRR